MILNIATVNNTEQVDMVSNVFLVKKTMFFFSPVLNFGTSTSYAFNISYSCVGICWTIELYIKSAMVIEYIKNKQIYNFTFKLKTCI